MTDLIAKLKAAKLSSRELDAEIWAHVHGGYVEWNGHHGKDRAMVVWHKDNGTAYSTVTREPYRDRKYLGRADQAPKYTGSIDVAFELVPDNWSVTVDVTPNGSNKEIATFVRISNDGLKHEPAFCVHLGGPAALRVCIAALEAWADIAASKAGVPK